MMPVGFLKRDPIPNENIYLDFDVFAGCWLGCKLDLDLPSRALLVIAADNSYLGVRDLLFTSTKWLLYWMLTINVNLIPITNS